MKYVRKRFGLTAQLVKVYAVFIIHTDLRESGHTPFLFFNVYGNWAMDILH